MIQIVQKPVITEKSLTLAAKGWYTFAVARQAAKGIIAQEVHRLYTVDVVDVRTVSLHGKTRRVGKRMLPVQRSDWKKAIVRLKEGQRIDAFEVAPTQEGAQATT